MPPTLPVLPYCPPGALPSHVRYDTHAGSPISPKTYGATGDGTAHYITAADIAAHPEWFDGGVCRYVAAIPAYEGDTWDYVGLQEAIYSAYGPPGAKHSRFHPKLNREIYIPAGHYLVNRRLRLIDVMGAVFAGAGRFSTRLTTIKRDEPILETNMVYSVIRDLMFEYNEPGAHCTVPTALVEWTWNGSDSGEPLGTAAGLAQLSVYDCEFHGGGYNNTIGFRCARDLYQGDNIVFHNCFFASCFYAGFATGDGAYNALNMCFYTCNFQRCPLHSILTYGGNIIVMGGSFQNGALGAPEPHKGWDIRLVGSANSASSIYGNRSESRRFLHADSSHYVDVRACTVIPNPPQWHPATDYVRGAIVQAVMPKQGPPPVAGSPWADGRPWVCIRPGTSAGVPTTGVPPDPPEWEHEPHWDGSNSTAAIDNTVRWVVSGPVAAAPAWQHNTAYAVGALMKPVLHPDGNEYVCVVAGVSTLVAAQEPHWAFWDTAGLADGTGGLAWAIYDYNVVEFDNGVLEANGFPWGRVLVGQNAPCQVNGNTFSRDDWLYKGAGNAETNLGLERHYNALWGNQVVHGGGINNLSPTPYHLPNYGPEPDHITSYSHFYLPPTTPLLFARNGHRAAVIHRAARDVGFWPSRGYFADGSNEDRATNVLGNIGALGPRHAPETANAVGEDQIIQGGLGRGTGASGRVLIRVAGPGAAGSNLNLPHPTLHALDISHERVKTSSPLQVLKVTLAQRNALIGLEPGDEIYCTTLLRKQVWTGFDWDDLSPGTLTWNPLTYFDTRLQGWWQIKDPTTRFQDSALTTLATATNHRLGGIKDKTTHLRHLLQADVGPPDRRPTLQLGVTNGHPVARHGGAEYLKTSAFDRFPLPGVPGPNTVVIIFRAYATGGYIFTPAATLVGTFGQLSAGVSFVFSYGANMVVPGDGYTQFATAICTYAEADSEAWLNGVRAATALQTGGLPQGLSIGAAFNGSSFAQVDWCEAFVVAGALTPQEVDYIGLYAQQYGTPEPFFNA